MNCKLIFPAMFLLVVFIASCQKQVNDSSENQNISFTSENIVARKAVTMDLNKEVYDKMVTANEARLALLNNDASRQGCVQTAIVPDDYETIQDAMDAVCKNGSIIVNTGTYNENVLVDKPGLSIKANGNVTVNGCFFLYPYADKVEIQNFNINPTGITSENAYNGIYGYGIHGGKIKQNTIIGFSDKGFGIVLENSKGISIEQNHVSGFEWGIVFRSVDGVSPSNNNIIQDNTITGISYASCIGLEGDCDLNLIQGNLVTENTNIYNAGIFCYSYIDDGLLTDNNVIKNNEVTYNDYTGIWIDGGSKNTIGPNNICNNSYTDIGIYISYTVTKTNVFNNTVLNNDYCDIVYELGADIKFNNNTCGCFDEW